MRLKIGKFAIELRISSYDPYNEIRRQYENDEITQLFAIKSVRNVDTTHPTYGTLKGAVDLVRSWIGKKS